MKYKYLIIGNSAGGIGAAEAIREVDPTGTIAIISDEEYHAYSRALVPYYLSDKISFDNIFFRPSDFYKKMNIQPILDKKVIKLDFKRRGVVLEDGKRILYEKLLIATGGNPIVPKMDGSERDCVFTFTTLKDTLGIRAKLEAGGVKNAVVLGGGLIGLLAAEAIHSKKVDVTVVELAERVLSPVLDQTASAMVEKVLKENGVKIVTGHTIKEILEDEIVLDNGEKSSCDLVIIGIGVAPRVDLVRDTPIKVNRGILVNKYMETSMEGVFACGDCAEVYDFILDSFRLTPLWPTAYVGGMVAGYNMTGMKEEYTWGTGMNSMRFFGLSVISAGIVQPESNYETLIRYEGEIYKKIVLNDDLIKGFILVNQIDRAGIILGLMRNKIKVADFKEDLLGDDFGLVYL
jgi:NAD(P)H-nitrite reductase large subunit